MSNEFGGLIPLLSTPLGGALSLMGSWGSIWFSTRSKNKHEAQQLAGATKVSYLPSCTLQMFRNYADDLKTMAQ